MEKFYEHIDDYLAGKLPEAERASFEKELADNPELREELNLYKEVEGSLAANFAHEKENNAVAENLKSMSGEFFTEEKKEAKMVTMQRSQWILRIAVAAAVILVVVFAWPYLVSSSPPQYADLANHPQASFTEMGGVEDLLPKAEKAFNEGDYAGAIESFQTYLLEDDQNTQVWFYLGICLLETDQNDSAEMLFKQISTMNSAYKTEAVWYLALTALKVGDIETCTDQLNQIPEGSSHYEEAQKTLKKLK